MGPHLPQISDRRSYPTQPTGTRPVSRTLEDHDKHAQKAAAPQRPLGRAEKHPQRVPRDVLAPQHEHGDKVQRRVDGEHEALIGGQIALISCTWVKRLIPWGDAPRRRKSARLGRASTNRATGGRPS